MNDKRDRYHKTEVGWIPKDWDCIDLGSVCINGGKYGAAAPSIDYSPDLPRYIRITDLTDDGRLRSIDIKSIRQEDAKGYLLDEGDFLFARTGATVGKTYLHNTKGNYAFAGYLIRFVPNPEKLLGSYLSNFTQSEKYWSWIRSTIHTGAQPNINAQEYSELHIPLPSIVEQKAIVQILSTWDHAIERVQWLIEAKQRQKKGLMQGLLTGRLRFSEFGEPAREKDEIPNGWSLMRLKQIGLLKVGGTPSTFVSQYWEGEIPWMNSGELNLKFVNSVKGRITESGMKNSNTSMVPMHSVLVGLAGQGKTRGTVAINEIPLCTNQSIAAIMPKEQWAHYLFLYYNLDSRYQEIRRMSAGDGGRGGLTLSVLGNMRVALPKIEEQLKIAQCLFSIDQNIKVLESKKQMLNQQKKGLMQKLLTGEIRVKVD